jgi:soluble lytic murein transglycosylase-like protein
MLTKLKLDYVALSSLTLLLYTGITTAAPDNDNKSPYQLNIEPAKIPKTINPSSNIFPNQAPQIYQLEYKYRSQSKPTKVKAALENNQPRLEPVNITLSDAGDIKNSALAGQPFSNEIALAAHATSLDPSLVHAVIYVESRYQHAAISPKGAVGLMQVLPDTAARYGLRDAVHLPKANIKAGTLYLRDLMVMFDNRLDLVLAAYNAGEGAVKKYARQIPPYPETRHYVKAVMAKYALNSGNNEFAKISMIKHEAQTPDLLKTTKARTQYLAGTVLVISNESFALNQ